MKTKSNRRSVAYRSFCFCAVLISISTDYSINLFIFLPFLTTVHGWLRQQTAMAKMHYKKLMAKYDHSGTAPQKAWS